MKKLLLILLAAVAFSCGDGNRQANESGTGTGEEMEEGTAQPEMESDTTMMNDTTSMYNDQTQRDSLR